MKNQLLKDYMERTKIGQKEVANKLGVSIATVSLYLRGEYDGNVEELNIKVEQFLARQKDKVLEYKVSAEFVPTFTARQIMATIQEAHIEGDMCAVYGASGLGKTQAVLQYAKENTGVILIETNMSYTAKVLLQKISEKLNLNNRGTLDQLFDGIVARLKGSERVIIIDEAENLPTRSLEFIRRIHDATKVGVALVGTERLLINLKGRHNDLAQVYNRIWRTSSLGNALPEKDLHLLTERALNTGEYNELFFKHSQGNARRLNKLIRGVVRLRHINECQIDERLIKEYTKMLIG
ncbi:AAA family ATPase [Glaesserella parasuis]|nr:AAA family ATPase [Glaesserella parasuis]MDP0481147.1 AAA family ATPase [Glaesserella parasuis]